MLLKASQWGLVGALFLGSLLPSECFPEAGNNQAANVSLNVKIHVGHSSTGTQNHAIIPATNQKIGNQRNAFGRRGAGNQLDVMPIARKVMRNQNGALPMGRLAPKHYQNIMPRVKVSAAHGDSVAEDYLESLESLMPWRDADEEDLNHVDDVELEGHEPLFPGETIDPELLLPAPPPALHEMNFTEQFPEMCVHRGATERHMSLRATAQYWGSLETFGVSQEGERAVTRNSNWDTRSKVACEMVPEGSRVLDIGCGPLMQVRGFLPPGCTYMPADVVPRTENPEDTFICDVNGGRYPNVTKVDVVMALGVAEYITDPIFFLDNIATLYRPCRFILTYMVRPKVTRSPRTGQTYLSKEAIEKQMRLNGFHLVKATGNIANEAMQYLFVWDYVGVSMMAAEAMTAADTANRQQRAYIYMAGSIALIGAVLMLRRLRRRLLLRRDVEGGGNTTALLSCVGHNSRAHNL